MTIEKLIEEASVCSLCKEFLPLGPRPVFSIHPESKILLIGQAPGTKVHNSGIPWDDESGRELRRWLGVDETQFYDPKIFGILPMGFCYPGRGKGGDMPPRSECAPQWHAKLREKMPQIQLTILIGQYAQKYYLQEDRKRTLTDTVRAYEEYLPEFLPLVHPSPRNRIWQRRNPWFEAEIVPRLQHIISHAIDGG